MVWIAATALGVSALFGGGIVAGAALDSGDSTAVRERGPGANEPGGGGVSLIFPAPAQDGGSSNGWAPATTGQRGGGDSGYAGLSLDSRYGGCLAPIPAALDGARIDPARLDFAITLLRDGFVLTGFAIRSDGPCDSEGKPPETGDATVDTSWRHVATGISVHVSQRVAKTAAANVLFDTNATFWRAGYQYNLGVDAYRIAIDIDGGPTKPTDAPTGSGVASPSPTGQHPEAAAVFEEAMGQLAPGLDRSCFYTQRQGAWGDLIALGVGDPRPAIPAGLTEQDFQMTFFAAPPASCGAAPLEEQGGAYASVNYSGAGGRLSINVQFLPEGSRGGPGKGDETHFSWSNGRFQFFVGGDGLPVDAVRAVATALDPGFANACIISLRHFSAAELKALRLRVLVAPDGYRLDGEYGSIQATQGDCSGVGGVGGEVIAFGGYNAGWTFVASDGRGVISATIDHQDASGAPAREGWISDHHGLRWSDGEGNSYSVFGEGGQGIRDLLIAVARSMDPALDVESLKDAESAGPGAKPIPLPQPAPDSR
ncbi:MAG: hypothetical protein ACR2HN_08470, partial [Tepidiformaceae bacterium]